MGFLNSEEDIVILPSAGFVWVVREQGLVIGALKLIGPNRDTERVEPEHFIVVQVENRLWFGVGECMGEGALVVSLGKFTMKKNCMSKM